MTEFDRARFLAGELPTHTRCGFEVLSCVDTNEPGLFPLEAVIRTTYSGDRTFTYTPYGRFTACGQRYPLDSELDLIYKE